MCNVWDNVKALAIQFNTTPNHFEFEKSCCGTVAARMYAGSAPKYAGISSQVPKWQILCSDVHSSNVLTLVPTALSELLINTSQLILMVTPQIYWLIVVCFRLSRLRIRYSTRLEVVELLLHPIAVVSHLSQLLRGTVTILMLMIMTRLYLNLS